MLFPCLNTKIQLGQHKCVPGSILVIYFSTFLTVTKILCISIAPVRRHTKDLYELKLIISVRQALIQFWRLGKQGTKWISQFMSTRQQKCKWNACVTSLHILPQLQLLHYPKLVTVYFKDMVIKDTWNSGFRNLTPINKLL